MSDIVQALADGRVNATALTKAYLARIEAYDRRGPMLNSVREPNPDALTIAGKLDDVKPSVKRPLAGVPILVKDNIATADKQPTTAGSQALQGARARKDATVVKLLRNAGAVILGKANLTEFANILALEMPSGYSSLGGQVKNPYAPDLTDDQGIPLVSPGGSSSGSAVAVAAGLCAASIGTETSGSLLFPASQNGLVTVKPTVGLISRAGILPISHSQDTAGQRARRGAAAERAGGKGPARPRDNAAAAASGLHLGPHARCDEGRTDRRAERPRRSAERLLLRQAGTQMGQGDD
jgi:amidase